MRTTYQVTRERLLLRAGIDTFAEARRFATGRFGIMMDANPGDVYLITKWDVLEDGSVAPTIMGTVDSAGFHAHVNTQEQG